MPKSITSKGLRKGLHDLCTLCGEGLRSVIRMINLIITDYIFSEWWRTN